jgi:hypothetical protein
LPESAFQDTRVANPGTRSNRYATKKKKPSTKIQKIQDALPGTNLLDPAFQDTKGFPQWNEVELSETKKGTCCRL